MGMTREECQRFADHFATVRRMERYAEDGKDTLADTMRISEDARIDSLLALAQEAERRGREAARLGIAAWLDGRAEKLGAIGSEHDAKGDEYRADEARTKSLELRAVASTLRLTDVTTTPEPTRSTSSRPDSDPCTLCGEPWRQCRCGATR